MAIKRGLGKGLSALLPTEAEENTIPESGEEYLEMPKPVREEPHTGTGEIFVPLDKLKANPHQPRKNFDEEELAELADSIRQQGIIQPIIAEDAGDGTYTIIAGERRTRAAGLAGLKDVPVILRKYSDFKSMEISLIENIQRSDLNPMEEASAYRQLMEIQGLSQDEAAAKVGKNRATVANALRLLRLPPRMQESIRKGEISPGHGRALLSVANHEAQEILYGEILKKSLSVRDAEKRAAALGSTVKKPPSPAKERIPELAQMEEKFITRLGTKVAVHGDLNKGTIMIDYYSMEDLDRLYDILSGL